MPWIWTVFLSAADRMDTIKLRAVKMVLADMGKFGKRKKGKEVGKGSSRERFI